MPRSNDSKEKLTRSIAERDGVREGLIAVLKCVEPRRSFGICKNRETQQLELRSQQRKCLHYDPYYLHPQLGFLHTRLPTWFPFTMQGCLNGREWLARQLDQAGDRVAVRRFGMDLAGGRLDGGEVPSDEGCDVPTIDEVRDAEHGDDYSTQQLQSMAQVFEQDGFGCVE